MHSDHVRSHEITLDLTVQVLFGSHQGASGWDHDWASTNWSHRNPHYMSCHNHPCTRCLVVIVAMANTVLFIILVRLCEHKLEIVKEALQSNPDLCKDSAKVIPYTFISSWLDDCGAAVGIKTCHTAWIKECWWRGSNADWWTWSSHDTGGSDCYEGNQHCPLQLVYNPLIVAALRVWYSIGDQSPTDVNTDSWGMEHLQV